MTRPTGQREQGIDRRRALTALGTVGLGSLLAACSGDSGGSGTASATSTTQVATTSGATTTVQPKTATGAAAKALLAEATTCTRTAELTEGPFYFDVDAIRSDIREDRQGALLRLALRVQQADSCTPISNAVVDIWHCDAGGSYSGFESASQGGPTGERDEETYLRGAQVTNDDGIVEFATIYPGWYRGRTTHIHLKVHLNRTTVLTSQLFFDEAVNSAVYANAPYTDRSGRETFNDGDGIYDPSLVVTTRQDGDAWLAALNLSVRSA